MAEIASCCTSFREILPKVLMPRDGIGRAAGPTMDRRRRSLDCVVELIGESLREVAVLIAVFAPLDMSAQGRPLTVRSMGVTIAVVVLVFVLGVFLEVKRRWTT